MRQKRGCKGTGYPLIWDVAEHFLGLEAKLAYDLSTASVSTLPSPNPMQITYSPLTGLLGIIHTA